MSVLVTRIQTATEQVTSAEGQYADLQSRIEQETREIEAERRKMTQERVSLEKRNSGKT